MKSSTQRFASLLAITCCVTMVGFAADSKIQIFDMDEIHDADTLDVKVLQDWHIVDGLVASRQKLVTINVGEFWPGQDYGVPVRMVVPVDGKANGIHLTGGNNPQQLTMDRQLSPIDQQFLFGGVGSVYTVVQDPSQLGLAELGRASEARFAKSLNPRDKIQYWAWPATMIRAITLAHSETDHFEPGMVAMSSGSKNGASPSTAIIHDDRMTGVHATVSPV